MRLSRIGGTVFLSQTEVLDSPPTRLQRVARIHYQVPQLSAQEIMYLDRYVSVSAQEITYLDRGKFLHGLTVRDGFNGVQLMKCTDVL